MIFVDFEKDIMNLISKEENIYLKCMSNISSFVFQMGPAQPGLLV